MLVSIYSERNYSLTNRLEKDAIFHHKTGGRGHWNFIIDYNKIKDISPSIHYNELDYESFKKWIQEFYDDIFYFSNENTKIIYVKNNRMGWAIGKGGWRIKKLQQEFGEIRLIQTYTTYPTKNSGEIIEIPELFRDNLNIASISSYSYPKLTKELLSEMEPYNIWDDNYYKKVIENVILPFFKENFRLILKKQIWLKVSELTPDLRNWGFRTGDLDYDLKYNSDHAFFSNNKTKKLLLDLYQIKKLIIKKDQELRRSNKYKYVFLDFSSNLPSLLVNFLCKRLKKIPMSVADIERAIDSGIDVEKTVEIIMNCYNNNTAKYEKKPNIIKK